MPNERNSQWVPIDDYLTQRGTMLFPQQEQKLREYDIAPEQFLRYTTSPLVHDAVRRARPDLTNPVCVIFDVANQAELLLAALDQTRVDLPDTALFNLQCEFVDRCAELRKNDVFPGLGVTPTQLEVVAQTANYQDWTTSTVQKDTDILRFLLEQRLIPADHKTLQKHGVSENDWWKHLIYLKNLHFQRPDGIETFTHAMSVLNQTYNGNIVEGMLESESASARMKYVILNLYTAASIYNTSPIQVKKEISPKGNKVYLDSLYTQMLLDMHDLLENCPPLLGSFLSIDEFNACIHLANKVDWLEIGEGKDTSTIVAMINSFVDRGEIPNLE